MLKKLRIGLLTAAAIGLTAAGASYAEDATQPAPSQDSAVNPSTAPAIAPDPMGPVAADTDTNQSTRPNDQAGGNAKETDMNTQPRTGANQSTRPNDDSTGSTEHKHAQKKKHKNQPDQSSNQSN